MAPTPPPDSAARDAQYQPFAAFSEWSAANLDVAMWAEKSDTLEALLAPLAADRAGDALEVATRVAAFDTGAIEDLYETTRGLTLTIATQEASWQQAMRSHDERLPDFFMAQMAAYKLAESVAASREPITQVWIRQLHEVLCEPQATYAVRVADGWEERPLPKGEYKTQPNHVATSTGQLHAYAPVDLTQAEMQRLVDEINGDAFSQAHGVLQAAYAHYCLAAVHPFTDGNGRVARALASVFVRRCSKVPLVVWKEQRTEYFDALEAADSGNHQAFVEFVFDRGIDAMTLVMNELGPRAETLIPQVGPLHRTHGGLTYAELDEKAYEIVQEFVRVAGEAIASLNLSSTFTVHALGGGSILQPRDPSRFRLPVHRPAVATLQLNSLPPAEAAVALNLRCVIARAEAPRYPFRLECEQFPGTVDLRLSDRLPRANENVTMQLRAFAKRLIGQGMETALAQAKENLRQAGYQ